jgi:hypothetical protein
MILRPSVRIAGWHLVLVNMVLMSLRVEEAHGADGSFVSAGLTFADVEPIVSANCATSGCHDGVEMFSLKTREDFFKRKPRPMNAINRGSMPKDNPDFKDSDDGKKLLEWLMGNQDV